MVLIYSEIIGILITFSKLIGGLRLYLLTLIMWGGGGIEPCDAEITP